MIRIDVATVEDTEAFLLAWAAEHGAVRASVAAYAALRRPLRNRRPLDRLAGVVSRRRR